MDELTDKNFFDMIKHKSMPSKSYFQFKYPEYKYLKIIPSSSLRNYHSDGIIKVIAGLYRDFISHFQRYNRKLFFKTEAKVGFYIYIEKHRLNEDSKVNFFFIIPALHYSLFKDKIIATWGNTITILDVDSLPSLDMKCTMYQLRYREPDCKSLVTDKRNNTLITNELSVLHSMEDGDKAGVFFNFYPTDPRKWMAQFDRTLNNIKYNLPTSNNKLIYIGLQLLNVIIKGCDIVFSSLALDNSDTKKISDDYANLNKDKRKDSIVNAQVILLAESKDKFQEENIAISLGESFYCLHGDNEFKYKKISKGASKKMNLLETKIKGASVMKISSKEAQNFLSLPANELLEEHQCIEHINVLQHDIPEDLKQGIIAIGDVIFKDITMRAYHPTLKNQSCLTLAIIGANRTGKSTYLANYCNDAKNGGECVICFDYCGERGILNTLKSVIHDIHIIDCGDFDNLQGMGYNEVPLENNPFYRYRNAKIQASQLVALIDSVNTEDRELKAKMNKLLKASALVVFLSNGKFYDVFDVLQDHELRTEYIMKVPEEVMQFMKPHIKKLTDLNETKEGRIIGTKNVPAIQSILDRVDNLTTNTYMELMLQKDCSKNFNLIEEMQKNQIIVFKMPETMFSNRQEKDVYCTYWLSKIWLSLKIRESMMPYEEMVKVNIVIDELHQIERSQEFLCSILSEVPKFKAKFVLSMHSLNQVPIIRKELRNANCGYIIISGADKENIKELKEELYPYSLEDFMNLKKYHSLNLIKMPDGYVTFVTHLPPELKPIKNKEGDKNETTE